MQIVPRTLLMILLYLFVFVSVTFPQTTPSKTDKLRQSAEKLAASPDPTADIKLVSGKKLTGRINSVATDSITFTENASQSRTNAFADVAKIEKHKKALSNGSWIAIASIAGGVTVLLIVLCPVYSWGCR